MKKKLLIIFTAVVIMFSSVIGCSKYPEIKVEEVPDAKYAVTSNGGMAVQYGNYIYFINGFKAINDTGKNNVWGDVVKGGIYQAEITNGIDKNITDYYGSYITYDNGENEFNDEFSGFETEVKTYEDNAEVEQTVNQIKTQPIVSKLITSANYKNGGLYIIDDYIYYTSPNVLKDKKGNIQYDLVDFYRTKLSGSGSQLIYRSKSSTAKPQFGYYKYDGSVYLAVYESSESKIYNVKITGIKINDAKVIADDVTSAIFPQKSVYYKNINENTLEDYIYYTRNINSDIDIETIGNIVERVRPNGSESSRNKILSNAMITLDKVANGYLFYFVEDSIDKGYYANKLEGLKSDTNGSVPTPIFSETKAAASTKVFGISNNEMSFIALAVNNNNAVRYQNGKIASEFLINGDVEFLAVEGNDVYYVSVVAPAEGETQSSTAILNKINYWGDGESQAVTKSEIKNDFLRGVDIAGGYVFYISNSNEIVEDIEDDDTGEKVPTLVVTSNYIRVKKIRSDIEWELAMLDESDYPDLNAVEEPA